MTRGEEDDADEEDGVDIGRRVIGDAITMSNLTKLEFVALDITGKNYLSWILDAEIYLDAMGLGDTIKGKNEASNQDKVKAMIFLRHHLHEGLKIEYLTIKDPVDLWKSLKERYDHQKIVILRLQDFKTENNELLMKNRESQPIGSAPFPEVNATSFRNSDRGCDRNHGRNCGRGKSPHNYHSRGGYINYYSDNKNTHQKWMNSEKIQEKDKGGQSKKKIENACYQCGMKGHWSRTCRTPKHLVELYQASLKDKGKNIETTFVKDNSQVDIAHLDVVDFFAHPKGRIDHLIGDENPNNEIV
ncbi:uncharacterized protein LOC110426814 [Herrania umbratica]|uniref:Uncharacterized protein LOC110426814 n=1 Tax=Herrania umbratica TaxID=108875 RepID=A0A6J1BE53_9ROSI|nr:uncharacterized protein LOC110426814 [Herrania umbratica]